MHNSSSFINRFSLGLLSLIVETVCLYLVLVLLFSGIEILNGISTSISLLSLLMAGGVSLLTNLILLLHRHRLFTHLVVNLLLGGLVLWFVLMKNNTLSTNDALSIISTWVALLGYLWQWKNGVYWAKNNPDYPSRVIRFELTTLLMIGLLFVATLTDVTIPRGALWTFIGLIANLSLLSLIQTEMQKGPKRLLGPALLILILLPVYLMASIVLPGLSGAAGIILLSIQPLLQIFKDMLLFIFVKLLQFNPAIPKSTLSDKLNTTSPAANDYSISALPSWITAIFHYLIWGIVVVIVLLLMGLIGYVLFQWVRRLQRTEESASFEDPIFSWSQLLDLIQRVIFWARRLVPWTVLLRPKRLDVFQSYQALIRWGAKRRIPRYRFETPNEYFVRLSKSFPTHTADIQYITDCYVLYCYGPKPSSLPSFQRLAVAVGNLYRRTPK